MVPVNREATELASALAPARPLELNIQVRTISQEVRRELNTAQEALAQGDAEKALITFAGVLAQEPQNVSAMTGSAAALQKLNRPAEAKRQLEAALAAGGDGFVLQANLALLLAERDPRAAAAGLPRPKPNEHNGAYHAVMGQIRAMAGDHLQAAEHWQKALRQNPFNATLLWNYAVSLDHLDRSAEAVDQYRNALLVLSGPANEDDTARLRSSVLARLQFLETAQNAPSRSNSSAGAEKR
jgi:Flp pilus assembly protein TadD